MATREPYVDPSHQVLIVGMHGRGKSVIAHEVLFRPVRSQKIMVNVKGDPKLTENIQRTYYPDEDHKPAVGDPRKLDWKKPVLEYVFRDAMSTDECDRLYQVLAKKRNLRIQLDECYGPTTSSQLPRGLGSVLQHGRFRNLGHVGCTQRPVGIAMPLRTEADHIIVLPRGLNPEDLEYVGKWMGLRPQPMLELSDSVVSNETEYGEYGHLWFEKHAPGKPTVHRRPSVRIK